MAKIFSGSICLIIFLEVAKEGVKKFSWRGPILNKQIVLAYQRIKGDEGRDPPPGGSGGARLGGMDVVLLTE